MELLLHSVTAKQIAALIRNPKGAYIFHGAHGIGKQTTALRLAQQLHCSDNENCASCKLWRVGNHPDLLVLDAAESASIGIAVVQELQRKLGLSKQDQSGRRMVLVDGAEKLTPQAQNCLLKTIEEPPAGTTIILLASNLESLLLTVRSRCQTVAFQKLNASSIVEFLTAQGIDTQTASQSGEIADGLPGLALALARDQKLLQAYADLTGLLHNVAGQSKFDRLTTVAKLAESGIDTEMLEAVLTRQTRQWLRTDQSDVALMRASAVEEFAQNCRSNVSLKTALSALVLQI